MSETQKPSAIIGALKTALNCESHAIARRIGVRRQFIYALRDDKPELPRDENRALVATLAEDPRYVALDAICREHGITGLFDAANAVLHSTMKSATTFTSAELFGPKRAFESALIETGAINDLQVANLWMSLVGRLRELAT